MLDPASLQAKEDIEKLKCEGNELKAKLEEAESLRYSGLAQIRGRACALQNTCLKAKILTV